MTQAVVRQRVSFEEYIDFCAQTNDPHELVQGVLVKMTPPTWQHNKIAKFLEQALDAAIKQMDCP